MSAAEQRSEHLASVPAERAVLGAIFADAQLLTSVADILQADDFYEPRHQLVFLSMLRLAGSHRPIDHLTVAEDLKAHGQLAKVGGPAYLMDLDQGVPLTANAAHYAEIVHGFALRRAGALAARKALSGFYDLQVPVERTAQQAASEFVRTSAPRRGMVNGQEVLGEVLDKSDEAQAGKKSTRLIPTGIRPLDEVITGVPLEEVTVICANPAVGKTTLAAAMAKAMCENMVAEAEKLAFTSPRPPPEACSYHCLEDSRHAIFRRYLAESSSISIRSLFEPGLTDNQKELRDKGAQSIHHWAGQLWMDDEHGQDVYSVARKIRYAVAAHGVRVAFVDHMLELVSFEDERRQDERVGEILRVLRSVAKDLGIAVVLLVHMRRPKDESIDYRFQKPLMQLIAGSEHISRAARLVIALWFLKPPPEPKMRKVPEPKKGRSREEAEKNLQEWQAEKLRSDSEYTKDLAKWNLEVDSAKSTLMASLLKVTEGSQLQDIKLRRILHAALVSRSTE